MLIVFFCQSGAPMGCSSFRRPSPTAAWRIPCSPSSRRLSLLVIGKREVCVCEFEKCDTSSSSSSFSSFYLILFDLTSALIHFLCVCVCVFFPQLACRRCRARDRAQLDRQPGHQPHLGGLLAQRGLCAYIVVIVCVCVCVCV